MPLINIFYHAEDGTWWADSPEVPGWTCVGGSLEETRRLAIEGVREVVGADAMVAETLPQSEESTGVFGPLVGLTQNHGISYAVSTVPTVRVVRELAPVPTDFYWISAPEPA
jgi:predicted RNase H-like HicB family nuclease